MVVILTPIVLMVVGIPGIVVGNEWKKLPSGKLSHSDGWNDIPILE